MVKVTLTFDAARLVPVLSSVADNTLLGGATTILGTLALWVIALAVGELRRLMQGRSALPGQPERAAPESSRFRVGSSSAPAPSPRRRGRPAPGKKGKPSPRGAIRRRRAALAL
jgi:hypothetical protein